MRTTVTAGQGKVGVWVLIAFFLLACSCGFSNPFSRGEPTPNANFAGTQLGDLTMAGAIESGSNEPRDIRDTFPPDVPIIYVVAEIIRVEPGTSVYARWSREGEPFEDSPSITADRVYENTNLEFHIEPVAGRTLEPGEYTVQIYINGNPGPTATFTIR